MKIETKIENGNQVTRVWETGKKPKLLSVIVIGKDFVRNTIRVNGLLQCVLDTRVFKYD